MAKISFIIPCYNSEDLLTPCFESLRRQTLTDVEFIFVDDGSTDGTREVIEKFIQEEARAKLVSQENGGLRAARLTGLENAKADFVTFLDSDDFVDTTAAEEALGIFEANTSVDAVLYNFSYVKKGVLSHFNYAMEFPVSGMDVLRYTIPSWRISTMGVYRRKDALNAYNSVDFSALNSDEVANRLIFQFCRSVTKMNSQYFYVQRGDSISKKPSRKYITRLETSSWLRQYSISKLADNVSRKDAETHYVNELCEIMFKFRSFRDLMEPDTQLEWKHGISIHRRQALKNSVLFALSHPLSFLKDIKLVQKSLFILAWPVLSR